MAYNCVMCPEGERARFVFMDTDDGTVAASCEGHIFDFIEQMAKYVMQTLGVDPAAVEQDGTTTEPAGEATEDVPDTGPIDIDSGVVDYIEPEPDPPTPKPAKPRSRKPKASDNGSDQAADQTSQPVAP
jgi:hypothetical protein